MDKREKTDLIIKLYLEGYNWNYISKQAGASFTTLKKEIKAYKDAMTKSEETRAFEKFDEGHLPAQVKMELDIAAEKIVKFYLNYNKVTGVADLLKVHKELGENLPGFSNFYNASLRYNITPENMNHALSLALRTSNLEQEYITLQNRIAEAKSVSFAESQNLLEIQRQVGLANQRNREESLRISRISNEIESLNTVLDKIKGSPESQKLQQIIREAVKNVSGQEYLAFEVTIIAFLKKIKEEPLLLQALLDSLPDIDFRGERPEVRQLFLVRLFSQVSKFMPQVIDELISLTGKTVLPDLKGMKDWMDQTMELKVDRPQVTGTSEADVIKHDQSDEKFNANSDKIDDTTRP